MTPPDKIKAVIKAINTVFGTPTEKREPVPYHEISAKTKQRAENGLISEYKRKEKGKKARKRDKAKGR